MRASFLSFTPTCRTLTSRYQVGYPLSHSSSLPIPVFPQICWNEGVDLWWHELMQQAGDECEPEWCDAEDPLFILYTSGSTGKPKASVCVYACVHVCKEG